MVMHGLVAMARRKVSTTVYITPEQDAALKELSQRTGVPVAVYIRRGIDGVLERHRDALPGQLSFEDRLRAR
jgi:predicted DNA-binding protein